MESLSNKHTLRCALKKARTELSQERREEASNALLTKLLPSLAPFDRVLSFASFGHEIDTSLLNLYLATTNRLLLPKIEGDLLQIYQVTNPGSQLIPNSFGLHEPNPKMCQEIEFEKIQVILVPAVGFDHLNHRLGYGKGFYDRFLKKATDARTIGVGFKEQLLQKLPVDPTDVSLEKVSLF